ncbi:MAG: c-type cytochrome [Gammaproteobacteria bacterium]
MSFHKSGIAVAVLLTFGAFSFASGQAKAPRSGKVVFDAACANCHTGGIGGFFSGAPTVGDKADWQALAPKGVDGLTATSLSGIGKMAARGGCTACSDAEIRAAVAYMLEKSK